MLKRLAPRLVLLVALLATLGLWLAIGCGGEPELVEEPSPEPPPTGKCELVVTPAAVTVEPGETVQFKAWWVCPGRSAIPAQ